jgi:hypothetical protein
MNKFFITVSFQFFIGIFCSTELIFGFGEFEEKSDSFHRSHFGHFPRVQILLWDSSSDIQRSPSLLVLLRFKFDFKGFTGTSSLNCSGVAWLPFLGTLSQWDFYIGQPQNK